MSPGAALADVAAAESAARPAHIGSDREGSRALTLAGHAVTLAAGLAASIPVIESTVKAVQAGWVPDGDDGIIATRAWDVFTAHTPLVGQYSEAGQAAGQLLHSPGPMLYWLLALPVRLGTVPDIAVTMGVVNTLCILGCVMLARRRGGLVLMFAAAFAVALMCQSLAGETLHDIWNPAAGLFPLLLLLFVGWSIACGDRRLLPLAALLASFVAQTHLAYAAPAAVVALVALAGLTARNRDRFVALSGLTARNRHRLVALLSRRARPSRIDDDAVPAAQSRRPPAHPRAGEDRATAAPTHAPRARPARVWPWALAALVVLGVCWAPPVLDELEHSPGNLTAVTRTVEHRGPTLGASVGWNAVVRSVGIPPWWLHVPGSEWQRKFDVRHAQGTAAVASAIAILALLLVAGLAGAWVRRWDLAAAAAIGLGLSSAIGLEASANPVGRLFAETLGYTMWWGSLVGLWVYLTLAWAAWLGLTGAVRRIRGARVARDEPALTEHPRHAAGLRKTGSVRPRRASRAGAALLCGAALAGVVASGLAAASTIRPDSHAYDYAPTRALARGIERAIPPGETISLRLGPLDTATQPIEPAIRFLLVRHGDRPLADGSFPRLGPYYVQDHRRFRWVLYLGDGTRAPRGMRLLARVSYTSPWGHETLGAWGRRVTARPRRP